MRGFLLLVGALMLWGSASPAQTVRTGEEVVSLRAAWPCYYYQEDGRWYDCPTGVVGGVYVLGPPIAPPELSAEVDFTLAEPTLFYLDGVARCEGCYNVLGGGQFALLHWDGSAWQSVFVGFADHIERCKRWSESCDFAGPAPGPWTLEPGRYKLWAQSSDGPQGFRLKTEIDISLKRVVEVDLSELDKGLANCNAALAAGAAQLASLESQLKALKDAEAMALAGGAAQIVDDLNLLRELAKGPGDEHVLELLDPGRKIAHLEARIALEREGLARAETRCRQLAAKLAELKAGKGAF